METWSKNQRYSVGDAVRYKPLRWVDTRRWWERLFRRPAKGHYAYVEGPPWVMYICVDADNDGEMWREL